jgi:hypothetical protein
MSASQEEKKILTATFYLRHKWTHQKVLNDFMVRGPEETEEVEGRGFKSLEGVDEGVEDPSPPPGVSEIAPAHHEDVPTTQ